MPCLAPGCWLPVSVWAQVLAGLVLRLISKSNWPSLQFVIVDQTLRTWRLVVAGGGSGIARFGSNVLLGLLSHISSACANRDHGRAGTALQHVWLKQRS